MLRYYGITELTGRPGSGKTAISMEEGRRHETVYVTTTTFCIRRYSDMSAAEMDRVLIMYIPSIDELASFVIHSLEGLVRARNTGLVVVDSLDHLLETEEKSPRLNNLIFRIVNKLKRINQKYSTNILVITCYYGGWSVGSFCIGNPLLGLGWMYMVNTRYMCYREEDGRVLRLVHSPMNDECGCSFEIGSHRVVYPEMQ